MGDREDLKITGMATDLSLQDHHRALRDYTSEIFPVAVEHLEALIRIPSLSLPSAPDGPIFQSAQAVKDLFAPLVSWDVLDIVSAGGGRPALIARKNPSPGRPTVLLYAHHDVQPAGDPASWDSDPFRPEVRNGRLYGRGSADDAAGIITHWQALRYLRSIAPDFAGLGVVVFVEGEEESGSPTFAKLLAAHRDVLEADVLIVADSDNPSPTTPALTTSLRGVVGMTVTLETGQFPLHSGMFGGVIPDAPTALIRLLATLHDNRGRSAITFDLPDDRPQVHLDEARLRRDSGVLPGVELVGEGSLSDSLWWLPSITVTGFDAPSPSQASNTLWPVASAKVSMRIPPTVSAEEAAGVLSDHLHRHAPWGARVTLSDIEKGPGFVGSTTNAHVALFSDCASEVFGEDLQFQGVGGTIPFISTLSEVFPEATVLVTGVEDPDSRAHGTNESVDISMLERTGLTEGLFLLRLSQLRSGN